jgi:hypothetical protein
MLLKKNTKTHIERQGSDMESAPTSLEKSEQAYNTSGKRAKPPQPVEKLCISPIASILTVNKNPTFFGSTHVTVSRRKLALK